MRPADVEVGCKVLFSPTEVLGFSSSPIPHCIHHCTHLCVHKHSDRAKHTHTHINTASWRFRLHAALSNVKQHMERRRGESAINKGRVCTGCRPDEPRQTQKHHAACARYSLGMHQQASYRLHSTLAIHHHRTTALRLPGPGHLDRHLRQPAALPRPPDQHRRLLPRGKCTYHTSLPKHCTPC